MQPGCGIGQARKTEAQAVLHLVLQRPPALRTRQPALRTSLRLRRCQTVSAWIWVPSKLFQQQRTWCREWQLSSEVNSCGRETGPQGGPLDVLNEA